MTLNPRQAIFDVLKVLAAQMIFFHHMSLYGPFSIAWQATGGELVQWIERYGRYAVQVFLVVAGALAGQSLQLSCPTSPWRSIMLRYLRLIRPYAPILVITVLLTAWARSWIAGDMLPAEQSWPSLFGSIMFHLSLTQGVLGIDSLSTGVWYLAIDFQLFVLMSLSGLLLRHQGPRLEAWPWCIFLAISLSAWYFNTNSVWDNWAPYFMASYGLGVLASVAHLHRRYQFIWWLGWLSVVAALVWHWRLPLSLAAVTAFMIWAWLGKPKLARWVAPPWIKRAANASYCFFLLNFPVLILCNLIWVWMAESSFYHLGAWFPAAVWLTVALSWLVAMLAASLAHQSLEK